jgi:membrane AbrB-like protein
LNIRKAVPIAGGLAICTLGGAVCAWIGTPLPWMIGSMLAMAAAQLAGAKLDVLPAGREVGFIVVGITLGLYFTAPVMAEVSRHWPWFVALGLAASAFGTLSALVLQRLSGVDRATAYFGSMPGGASEMATLGEQHGALADRVAVAHSLRMLLVVTVFPIGITLAGFSASDDYRPVLVAFHPGRLALLVAAAALTGWIARKLRAPTAFMLGPLLLTIGLTSGGVEVSSMPSLLVNAAQVFLGAALGVKFDPGFFRAAPRFMASLAVSVTITLVVAGLVGAGIAFGSGAYLGSALLAAAPGGIAEMSITARVLRLGVAYVTAAHVVRYIIVVLLTVPVYRLLQRGQP